MAEMGDVANGFGCIEGSRALRVRLSQFRRGRRGRRPAPGYWPASARSRRASDPPLCASALRSAGRARPSPDFRARRLASNAALLGAVCCAVAHEGAIERTAGHPRADSGRRRRCRFCATAPRRDVQHIDAEHGGEACRRRASPVQTQSGSVRSMRCGGAQIGEPGVAPPGFDAVEMGRVECRSATR